MFGCEIVLLKWPTVHKTTFSLLKIEITERHVGRKTFSLQTIQTEGCHPNVFENCLKQKRANNEVWSSIEQGDRLERGEN